MTYYVLLISVAAASAFLSGLAFYAMGRRDRLSENRNLRDALDECLKREMSR